MSTPPPELTKLELNAAMQDAVDEAFASGKPIAIAYVDENGAPQLSYRGSTQAYGETALALWVRNPRGRILESIAGNPSVALIFGDFNRPDRRFMVLRGRARIDSDETVRKRVYEHAHEFERKQDPERKGVALIIDLDSVDGLFDGARLKMRR